MGVLQALVWKNVLLRANHWVQTLREILVPIVVMFLVNFYLPSITNDFRRVSSAVLVHNSHDFKNHDEILLYQPSTPFIDRLMKDSGQFGGFKLSNVRPGNISQVNPASNPYSFGLELGVDSDEKHVDYTIYPGLGVYPTSLPVWYGQYSLIGSYIGQSAKNIIAEMQDLINTVYLSYQTDDKTLPEIRMENMDMFNREFNVYGFVVILAIFFAYSFLVAPVITRVVEEKQSGAKELMLMMGVKSWQLWLTKTLDAIFVASFVMLNVVFLLYVPIRSTSTVLMYPSPVVFSFFLITGMLAVIVSLFFLSCWFDSPTLAAMTAQIIGMASAILLGLTGVTAIAWWKRMLYCLMPQMTLIYAAQILLKFDFYKKAVNLNERLSLDESELTLSEVAIMMILDIFIYSILTWYCDKIWPGKYGVPRPWNFFLQSNYWNSTRKVTADTTPLKDGVERSDHEGGISIQDLRKVYQQRGRAPVVAVDSVSLDAPRGTITALLGHNGAGKSTTMSILTGMIPATSGNAVINGHNIRTNPDGARSSLGLCPQQDFLFRDLTALQTLVFFASVKGLKFKSAYEDAELLLETLKMSHAKNRSTQDLSGGMKRKLSLGIALIGGSKTLILDEPTAGVDPEQRREICDLLLSFKGVRTILLTTHIMEEADAVSDFIYILDHGKVQCSGTSLDLKTQFGTGYTLQVVISDSGETLVKEAVEGTVEGSRYKARNAATLSFQLPSLQAHTFPLLFEKLDAMQGEGTVISYSVSVSTLEDVFVRVREIEEERARAGADEVDASPYRLLASNTELNVTKLTGLRLLIQQFSALVVQKATVFIRSIWHYLIFAAIGICLLLLSEWIAPQLAKLSNNRDKGMLKFFNYSTPMYEGMEILYLDKVGCVLCPGFKASFRAVAEERGFRVTHVTNISSALKTIFDRDFHEYTRYVALAFEVSDAAISFRYNSQAVHMVTVAIDMIYNSVLRASGSRISASVNLTFVEEFPDSLSMTSVQVSESSFADLMGVQTLCYMAALLSEKHHGAQALQLMAVPAWLYWLGTIAFDYVTFMPYSILAALIYYLFLPDDQIFDYPALLIPTLILWGIGLILISYVITFFTRTQANAITIALLVYYVFCFFAWPLIQATVLPEWIAYLHPTSIWKLGLKYPDSPYPVHLLIYVLVLYCLLVFLQSTILGRIFHSFFSCMCRVKFNTNGEEDSDVCKETQAVNGLMKTPDAARDVLLASGLRRWYGLLKPTPAVRGVSFRVVPGECFGLLGVNGAGKSSTFNMLTGQIASSEGDAVLNQSHLASWWPNKYLSQVSYCPQSSGIIPQLEGKEFLELFARLRGYKRPQVKEIVGHWIKVLDLEDCARRQCGKYSGGMERKLSAAAAFLWDAAIVMLDEPTNGVDPVARRSIWKAVTAAQAAGKSVVLTSHSMEECEALCSRLAIMVDGSFRCIGETTTLKNKFGGGYSVQLKLSSTAEAQAQADAFHSAVLQALGPNCELTDRHCSILHYHIKDQTTNWKILFARLEDLKKQFKIFESYMASETTLEEIFLSFASRRSPSAVVASSNVCCVEIP